MTGVLPRDGAEGFPPNYSLTFLYYILTIKFQVASPHLDRAAQSKNSLRIGNAQTLGTFRGGSLPDVSVPRPGAKVSSSGTGRDIDAVSKVTVSFKIFLVLSSF